MPPPKKKIRIDFILSKIDRDGNEIQDGELQKAVLEISDKYGGSTTLVGTGYWVNKEGRRAEEKIMSFYIITDQKRSVIQHDLPRFKRNLERRLRQDEVLITYHDVAEVT